MFRNTKLSVLSTFHERVASNIYLDKLEPPHSMFHFPGTVSLTSRSNCTQHYKRSYKLSYSVRKLG